MEGGEGEAREAKGGGGQCTGKGAGVVGWGGCRGKDRAVCWSTLRLHDYLFSIYKKKIFP